MKPRYRWNYRYQCYDDVSPDRFSNNPNDALRKYWSYYPNEKPPQHLVDLWKKDEKAKICMES
jgi:hypothetical protein